MSIKGALVTSLGVAMVAAAAFGIWSAVGASSPTPEGPRIGEVIQGPSIPELTEDEKARALQIALADGRVREILGDRPYSVEHVVVWTSDGKKIGGVPLLRFDQEYLINYDWPSFDYDKTKFPFPHYKEITIPGPELTDGIHVMVDFSKDRVVGVVAE